MGLTSIYYLFLLLFPKQCSAKGSYYFVGWCVRLPEAVSPSFSPACLPSLVSRLVCPPSRGFVLSPLSACLPPFLPACLGPCLQTCVATSLSSFLFRFTACFPTSLPACLPGCVPSCCLCLDGLSTFVRPWPSCLPACLPACFPLFDGASAWPSRGLVSIVSRPVPPAWVPACLPACLLIVSHLVS